MGRIWGGGRCGQQNSMESGARQHENTDESDRQRSEVCRIGEAQMLRGGGAGRRRGAEGRHQSYGSQKFEAREVSGKEGRSHLPEMLAFFIVIISPNIFDLHFLSLMTLR